MAISFSLRGADASTTVTPLLAVLLPQATRLPAALRALDEAMGGALRRTLTRKDFRGARDETLHLEGARLVKEYEREFVFIAAQALSGRDSVLLTGTAEIRESPERAAVFAVMDATNRWSELRRPA